MTSNDKDRPFISQCITGSSNSLPQDHFKKKCVQDLTCPLSRNWEHSQRFCLRWKDIYTSNTAFPERYLGRRSLQPAATQLHTGSTKIAGAVRRETWPGDARGLIQQNNRVFFFLLLSQLWGTKPSLQTSQSMRFKALLCHSSQEMCLVIHPWHWCWDAPSHLSWQRQTKELRGQQCAWERWHLAKIGGTSWHQYQ